MPADARTRGQAPLQPRPPTADYQGTPRPAWTESDLDIQTFAHIAAHDLKAPMSGMATLAGFLREDYGECLGEAGNAELDLLQRLAARGLALVDALTTYARAATVPLVPSRLDMQTLAAEALAAVAVRSGAGSFTPGITTSLAPAAGDPALVRVLLEQLIHNAATFHGDPAPHVEVRSAVPSRAIPAGQAAYAVRDRGFGMPSKHLDEIFDLFKRLHGPDAFGGRAGAGLATCRLIVERHGGAIWAESAEGHGSTLVFTLPLASP